MGITYRWLEALLDPGSRRILLLDAPAALGHRASREFDQKGAIAAMIDRLLGGLAAAPATPRTKCR